MHLWYGGKPLAARITFTGNIFSIHGSSERESLLHRCRRSGFMFLWKPLPLALTSFFFFFSRILVKLWLILYWQIYPLTWMENNSFRQNHPFFITATTTRYEEKRALCNSTWLHLRKGFPVVVFNSKKHWSLASNDASKLSWMLYRIF